LLLQPLATSDGDIQRGTKKIWPETFFKKKKKKKCSQQGTAGRIKGSCENGGYHKPSIVQSFLAQILLIRSQFLYSSRYR